MSLQSVLLLKIYLMLFYKNQNYYINERTNRCVQCDP